MKKTLTIFFLGLLSVVLSSCGMHSSGSKYYAVKHYKPRASSLGFSIVPPPGDNWYEKLKQDSLYYLKIVKSHKRYSILTEAREVRLQRNFETSAQLLQYVKREKELDQGAGQLKKVQVNVRIEESLSRNCVRYSRFYEDHGVEGLRGRRHVNVETQGLFCLHPDNNMVGVDVSYMEKSLSNTKATSFKKEGELFLASLNFQKVQKN